MKGQHQWARKFEELGGKKRLLGDTEADYQQSVEVKLPTMGQAETVAEGSSNGRENPRQVYTPSKPN